MHLVNNTNLKLPSPSMDSNVTRSQHPTTARCRFASTNIDLMTGGIPRICLRSYGTRRYNVPQKEPSSENDSIHVVNLGTLSHCQHGGLRIRFNQGYNPVQRYEHRLVHNTYFVNLGGANPKVQGVSRALARRISLPIERKPLALQWFQKEVIILTAFGQLIAGLSTIMGNIRDFLLYLVRAEYLCNLPCKTYW